MINLARQPWEKLSEQLVFDSYRKIISRLFRLPDGRKLDYEVFTGQPYVVIAAFTTDGQAIITKQFRPGPADFLQGFASGIIDPGEVAVDAASRELLEETGYRAAKMEFIKEVPLGYGTFSQHTFLATGCEKIAEQALDSTEFIEVELWSIKDLLAAVRDVENKKFVGLEVIYLALDKLDLL